MTSPVIRLEETISDDYLHAIVFGSPIVKGRISGWKTPELPDDYLIITRSDLQASTTLNLETQSMPILTDGEIAYRGQPIAVVTGPDLQACTSLRDEIDVNYERSEPHTIDTHLEHSRVRAERLLEGGDIEKAFTTAYQVTEGEYSVKPAVHRLLDTIGAMVTVTEKRVDVWTASRWLYHVRDTVADVLGRN